MIKEQDIFYSFDVNGRKNKYKCLKVIYLDTFGKTYIAYEDGGKRICLSVLCSNEENLYLQPIVSSKEWRQVFEHLKTQQ